MHAARSLGIVCILVAGCGAATRGTSAAPAPRRSVASVPPAPAIDEAALAKLDSEARFALDMWRQQLEQARTGQYPSLDPAEIDARRVTVSVRYTGPIDALRAAGLQTGYDSDGTVSGIIRLRDLGTLAAVPGVVRIQGQPTAEPNGPRG